MKVIILNGRLSFADLHTPKSIKGSALAFSATVICDKDTKIKYTNDGGETKIVGYEVFQKICDKVTKDKFGGKIPAKLKNWCFNKADGSTTRDEYIDPKKDAYWDGFDSETWYISAKKPLDRVEGGILTIFDENKKQVPPNSGKVYSGCRVNMIVSVYAMDKEGASLQAGLEAIQYAGKGEPLGRTSIDASSDFDSVEIPAEDMDEADAGQGAADVADDML